MAEVKKSSFHCENATGVPSLSVPLNKASPGMLIGAESPIDPQARNEHAVKSELAAE